MNNYFSQHIGYQKAFENRAEAYNVIYSQYKKDLERYLGKISNATILEIGCGMGKFTYFCEKIGVKDYTGIDIDDYFFEYNRKDFPNYKFIKIGFQEYLKEHKNEFDIIFVSHVFEHLDEKERIEMITSIYSGLKEGGIWINYMPNADNFLWAGSLRRGDITHKTIYSDISFGQVVNSTNLPFEIENFNTYVGVESRFRRIIHIIFRYFTKIYFVGMGKRFPNLYTWEFISVLTKKGKN